MGYGEEVLLERRVEGLSDHFFIIMLAFLAGSEQAPAEMDGKPLISFKDNAEYVLFVEKKLQGECLVVDLIGFPVWEFCDFHRIGNGDPGIGVVFKRNPFKG